MLRKIADTEIFAVGDEVFLVTRKGEVLEGFRVLRVLGELVSLDRPPLEGEKQGFTVEGTVLRPNWCAGRKALVAGCRSRAEAEVLAARRRR